MEWLFYGIFLKSKVILFGSLTVRFLNCSREMFSFPSLIASHGVTSLKNIFPDSFLLLYFKYFHGTSGGVMVNKLD